LLSDLDWKCAQHLSLGSARHGRSRHRFFGFWRAGRSAPDYGFNGAHGQPFPHDDFAGAHPIAAEIFRSTSGLQAPLGFVTDMLGARRLLVAALLPGGLSLLCLAFPSDYAWLATALAAAGLANGVYHPADYALLSAGIGRSRIGRAFSIHTFAGYIGTAIAPAALLSVAAAGGVEMSFAAAGLIGIAVALLVLTPI